MGYRHKENADVKLWENLVVGKIPLRILWWNSLEACGNTIISSGRGIEIETPANPDYSKYKFGQNNILANGKIDQHFVLNGEKTAFSRWLSQVNYGACDTKIGHDVKTENFQRIFVNQNKYDKTRAYVTIYRTDGVGEISVDLSGFLGAGKKFAVWDAQDFFGAPVLSGVYDGKPIRLPLTGEKIGPPIGDVEQNPAHTGTNFSVFVVRQLLSSDTNIPSR